MSHELTAGPFGLDAVLPDSGSTARDIVMRALAGESLKTDPGIEVEAGVNRDHYLWRSRVRTFQRAAMTLL